MSTMTDDEREAHILYCGRRMQDCMFSYSKTGNPEDRKEADRWRQDMEIAISQRSPAQVAKMEAARGLTPEPYFLNKAEEDMPAILRRQAA